MDTALQLCLCPLPAFRASGPGVPRFVRLVLHLFVSPCVMHEWLHAAAAAEITGFDKGQCILRTKTSLSPLLLEPPSFSLCSLPKITPTYLLPIHFYSASQRNADWRLSSFLVACMSSSTGNATRGGDEKRAKVSNPRARLGLLGRQRL